MSEVPLGRLELPLLTEAGFEAATSTNSIIGAYFLCLQEDSNFHDLQSKGLFQCIRI